MGKESFVERQAGKEEVYEQAAWQLDRLAPFLAEQAQELRERGFSVDDTCRIEPGAFAGFYSAESLTKDKKAVEYAESKFETAPSHALGELLEVTKTAAFNSVWFNKRLVALRTAKYDDYVNGIDQLVVDSVSRKPVALVDTTTDLQSKMSELMRKIMEGGRVKYGFGIQEDGHIIRTNYAKLPILILSLKPEEVLALASELDTRGDVKNLKALEGTVARMLYGEAKNILSFVPSGVRGAYEDAAKILKELKG